jgi:2'-5' RNA ligase
VGDHFLDHEFTQPTELRDFFEWHQGIKHYGFWAIEILNQDCVQQIQLSQEQLADKLHSNYLRQPHITLSASGLRNEQHFTQDSLQRQIKNLKESNFSSFSLYLSKAHSFTTAPYLSIRDPFNYLDKIRELLNSICVAEDANEYTPHVTLGFYDQAYQTAELFKRLSCLNIHNKKFTVKEIVFAQYNTHEIQGQYKVLHRITLNEPINNNR